MTRTINTWKRRGGSLSRFELAEVQEQYNLTLAQYEREHNGKPMPGPERGKLWQTLARAKAGRRPSRRKRISQKKEPGNL